MKTEEEKKEDREVTESVNVLDKILDKLNELCDRQHRQSEKLEEVIKRISDLEVQVELVREQQVATSKSMAEMRQTCEERPFRCRAAVSLETAKTIVQR